MHLFRKTCWLHICVLSLYRIINCIPVGGIKLIAHFKQNLMKVNYATLSHNSPKSMFQFVDNNDRTVVLIGKELHSILFAQHVFLDSSTICSKDIPWMSFADCSMLYGLNSFTKVRKMWKIQVISPHWITGFSTWPPLRYASNNAEALS